MQWVRVGEPVVQRQRGKWVVRQSGYDPASGRRRVKQLGTFTTKRAAVPHQKVLAQARAGSDGETLREFLEHAWLPSKDGRVELAAFDQYSWAVRRHIVPLLGAVRLRDLTAEVVDGWLVEFTAGGCTAGPGGRWRRPWSAPGEKRGPGVRAWP